MPERLTAWGNLGWPAAAEAPRFTHRNKPLPQKMIAFGEIGLAGEIRPVPNGQERLREAAKHGFTHAVIPKDNLPRKNDAPKGMTIIPVHRVSELLDIY